jgi:uncharacterized membrane protein YhfC
MPLQLEARSAGIWRALTCPACRSRRVVVLLAAIILMSLGDLYMTLEHLTHVGMPEANPLAHAIIQYGSRSILIAWKLATVVLAVGILYYARRRWSAEAAALFCCGVLTWLSARWLDYSEQMLKVDTSFCPLVLGDDHRWVTLP